MIRALVLGLAALAAVPAPQSVPSLHAPQDASSLRAPQGASALRAPQGASSLLDRAATATYNLDYDTALDLARQAVAAAPDDPRTHRNLATDLWLDVIFQRGAVTTDTYLSGVTRTPTAFAPAAAGLDAECRQETARAVDLAEAWIARDPKSLDARFELGSIYALRASYIASMTGNNSGAFGAARRAYDAEAAVVDRDPSRTSATVVVGLYRYIVSTLALPSRWLAYVVGFDGDKAKGISMLEGAAATPVAGHVEAAVSLLLIYAREGRHADAVRLATRLEQEYPRNRLFTLEAGSAAIRAGHGAEADTILTRGLAALATDSRPRFPGEQALWLMKRGTARRQEARLNDASSDLRAALAATPPAWIAGRSHLELGRVADLETRRADALAEYRQSRTLCTTAHDDACVNDANRLADKPFRVTNKAPAQSDGGTIPVGSSLKVVGAMASTKTWIVAIAGFLGICVLILFAIAGTGVYFVSQHIESKRTSSAAALHEFDAARETLKGKTPLLELDRLGRPRQIKRTESMPTSPVRPTDMVILAWNPDRGHVVRVSLPFWLLHIGRRKIDILDNSNSFDIDRLNIDIAELERIGPAFVLDYVTPSGERVLVWTK